MTVRDMLTEDEAKTKWCPLVRVLEFEDKHAGAGKTYEWVAAAVNRSASDIISNSCVAAKCMFWRWSQQDREGVPTGFCGAAGLPKYI